EASDGAEPEDAADEATDPADAPGDEDAEATEESDETGESDGSDADGSPVPSTVERTRQWPEPTKTVTDAGTLRTALESALPGDVIRLEPGTYEGEFVAQSAGTQEEPITLCGDQDAGLVGAESAGGYSLHLDGASHWRLLGVQVTRGQKGVIVAGTDHT